MEGFPYLNAWLQCLLHLAPPLGLVHVGAGGGRTIQYPFSSLPRLVVIEADVQRLGRLQYQLQGHPRCELVRAVVAAQDGEADFHTLSQSDENGICPQTKLQVLWPNIKTLATTRLPTVSLQKLLELTGTGASTINWAIFDCLPSGELLKGAGSLLAMWDVVVVRAIKDVLANDEDQALRLDAICQQLAGEGLYLVALEEEIHPNVVRALFVKNHCEQLAVVKADALEQCAAMAKKTSESNELRLHIAYENKKLIARVAALTRARDDLVAQNIEKANIISSLKTSLADVNERIEQLARGNEKMMGDNSELAKVRDEIIWRSIHLR